MWRLISTCLLPLGIKKDYHVVFITFVLALTVMHVQLIQFPTLGQVLFILNPPFSCIGSVLQNIEQDNVEGVMAAPLFSTQPWFHPSGII